MFRSYKETPRNFVKRELNKQKTSYDQLSVITGINRKTLINTINALDKDREYYLRRGANLWIICEHLGLNMWDELKKIN